MGQKKDTPYENFIFDFDGTLADTQQGVVMTVNAVLADLGRPPVPAATIQAQIGLPLRETFVRAADITDDATLIRCVRLYRELFETVGAPHVRLFPHARATLASLHAHEKPVAVASSRGRASLERLTDFLDIRPFLALALGEEDVVHKKPAPDLVLEILARLHLCASATLVIGDTVWDMRMGQEAGCATAGALWGNSTRTRLESARPTYLLTQLDQVGELAGLEPVTGSPAPMS